MATVPNWTPSQGTSPQTFDRQKKSSDILNFDTISSKRLTTYRSCHEATLRACRAAMRCGTWIMLCSRRWLSTLRRRHSARSCWAVAPATARRPPIGHISAPFSPADVATLESRPRCVLRGTRPTRTRMRRAPGRTWPRCRADVHGDEIPIEPQHQPHRSVSAGWPERKSQNPGRHTATQSSDLTKGH